MRFYMLSLFYDRNADHLSLKTQVKNVTWVSRQALCYQRQNKKQLRRVFTYENDMANHEERHRIIGLCKVNLRMARFRRQFGKHCLLERNGNKIRYNNVHTVVCVRRCIAVVVLVLTSQHSLSSMSQERIYRGTWGKWNPTGCCCCCYCHCCWFFSSWQQQF